MQYRELSTGTGTYVIKTGAGFLQGIQVNVAAAATTLQIFDQTSAAAPAIAGGAAAFPLSAVGTTPFYRYNCSFTNGLTIVVGGSGTFSLTVLYY